MKFNIFDRFRGKLQHEIQTRHSPIATHFFNHPVVSFSEQLNGSEAWIIQTRVSEVTAPDIAEPGSAPQRRGDVLITNLPGIPLQIRIADCASVLLYDARQNVIANIHAGWRGLAQKVIHSAIQKLHHHYRSRSEDLFAGISPMLGPCCSKFSKPFEELPLHMHRFISEENHVDLWAATEGALRENGVPAAQIENPRICTCCHPEDFFSYRREGNEKRFATLIMLD